ncbi:MAG TPA: hypothetical protein VIG38_07245 [Hyphomicrobium sp.]|jgi:hypothetical protein
MNRRSFLGLFGKSLGFAAVPTPLLRSAAVADNMPLMMVSLFAAPKALAAARVRLPENLVFCTPASNWFEVNPLTHVAFRSGARRWQRASSG